jgi:hypothetical protein
MSKTRTVTATVNAYVTNTFTTIDELYNGEPYKVISALKLYDAGEGRNAPDSWVLAGTAEVTLTLNEPDSLNAHKVDSLKAELQKTQADAEVKCNKIREQINSLLAIEYKP